MSAFPFKQVFCLILISASSAVFAVDTVVNYTITGAEIIKVATVNISKNASVCSRTIKTVWRDNNNPQLWREEVYTYNDNDGSVSLLITAGTAYGVGKPASRAFELESYANKNISTTKPDLYNWANCIVSEKNSTPGNAGSDMDTVTPQVAGCPKYLSKSNVRWSKKPGSNPQLNVWEVRNISKKILKVVYRSDGVNSDSGTLNPGDSAEVWQITEPPPYVVRDFKEITEFNRTQPQKKALKCDLAIRPQ